MIKFFRNIRQAMIKDNRVSKYFLYALGEIILVVIGILIALQINNWNNQQQEQQFEKKVLREILADAKADLKETNDAINGLRDSQESTELIIEALNKNLSYNDSLDVHFAKALRFWSLSPNSTAFEAAKAEGLYLIKNDSIRKIVSTINGYLYDYVGVLENRWQDYNTNIVLPHILPLFDNYNFTSMKALDYESLKRDSIFIGMLKSLYASRTRYMNILEIRYTSLLKLISLLEDELK